MLDQPVFVTGATGYLGRALIEKMAASGFKQIVALRRNADQCAENSSRIRYVTGDLQDTGSYERALRGVAAVVHLAAATGSASVHELFASNVDGTRALVQQSVAAGVEKFIFVSSIASTFPDLREYPYGRTKKLAEEIVREEAPTAIIIRPTIILGGESQIGKTFAKIARLPVIPLIGGGTTRIQPVDVQDVANGIVQILLNKSEHGFVDFAGPEIVTFKTIFKRYRRHAGLSNTVGLPIPVWPIRLTLKILAGLSNNRFPIGVGQVAPFLYDSVANTNYLSQSADIELRGIDEMIRSNHE